jgi:hypothetical protein
MQPKQDTYPVFEANQVLTNRHLNQVFDYLDEQERLTRANLIGIGIVCGLEIKLTTGNTSVLLSKGCGVTSEGYLIVEPAEEVALVEYKTYTLPDEVTEYLPFKYDAPDPNDNNKTIRKQYDLWELFEAGEPNSTKLTAAPANFLNDKAVLLFLELKKDGLRNCSPNNCDDKGAEVTATVRRLLVRVADLMKIIAAANGQGTALTPADLESVLLARLKLPDIRLPRYNVPNTEPATSEDVYSGFLDVFRAYQVVSATGSALSEAYKAFEPLLLDDFPADPFAADFSNKFGFLDTAPTSTGQVRFLQYYYDLFDDLLKAYDEFRWKGAELMCACCPPGGLFPRHLMLGVLRPDLVQHPGIFRHPFLASSAISGCEERTEEVQLLFRRLVEMVRSFTESPQVPTLKVKNKTIPHIRITPSKLADVPLSDKAIPYYYAQNGAPPLFQQWNARRTRRGRANQNLSYRSYQYTPAPPLFVTEPLRYDLEPYNFLRVEGHLNQNYQDALEALLQMKETFRLPIEIIALRTGAFDEKISVDLSQETCRFQDLESLYDVTREEWFCFLAKMVVYMYDLPRVQGGTVGNPTKPSQFTLLNNYAPGFLIRPNSIGEWFESYITGQSGAVPDWTSITNVLVDAIEDTSPTSTNPLIRWCFVYIMKASEYLKADIRDFNFSKFKAQFDGLHSISKALEARREAGTGNLQGGGEILHWEEIDDRLEDLLNTCIPEKFKAILDEYARRIIEVKQKQFLSFFLQRNPGIQHKAGVPMGGTFILVYHDDIEPVIDNEINVFRPGDLIATITQGAGSVITKGNVVSVATTKQKDSVANRILSLNTLSENDKKVIISALGRPEAEVALAGARGNPLDAAVEQIISETVEGLSDGTVIADFFLPYLCCSDCSPVQFSLPAIPPTFAFEVGCTDAKNQAEVTITPSGGVAPYSIKVDGNDFVPLTGKVLLFAGDHEVTIRDSAGIQSLQQKVTVQGALVFGAEKYECNANGQFIVQFAVNGGRPPFTSPQGSFSGVQFTGAPVASGNAVMVEVTDSAGCKESKRYVHICKPPCDYPCDAISCQYRFWIPIGSFKEQKPVLEYNIDMSEFTFDGPGGDKIDITADVKDIISKFDPAAFNENFRELVQSRWIDPINQLIADKTKDDNWFRLEYLQNDQEQFGILRIEYFECLNFTFKFYVNYQHPKMPESYLLSYSSKEGFVMVVPGANEPPVIVPPIGCEKRNKCETGSQWTPVCTTKPFSVNIVRKEIDSPVIFLRATTSGANQPTSFVWEVDAAKPSLANGADVQMNLVDPLIFPIKIRVTAFAANGCSLPVVDFIDFNPQ